MSKRGRSPGFVMTQEHRSKIGNSKVLSNLISHAEGKLEMSSSQVTAGLGLLKKVLPDLGTVEFDGSIKHEAGDSLGALLAAIDGRTRSK